MCVYVCERERERQRERERERKRERERERERVCVKLYLLNAYDTFRTNYAVIT